MWRLILISLAAMVVLSCSAGSSEWVELTAEPDIDSAPFQISGTVKYLDVEGGVFVIQSDSTQYNPVNLPDTFKSDGMSIEAEVRRRDDLMSTAMVGPVIELLRIRHRS